MSIHRFHIRRILHDTTEVTAAQEALANFKWPTTLWIPEAWTDDGMLEIETPDKVSAMEATLALRPQLHRTRSHQMIHVGIAQHPNFNVRLWVKTSRNSTKASKFMSGLKKLLKGDFEMICLGDHDSFEPIFLLTHPAATSQIEFELNGQIEDLARDSIATAIPFKRAPAISQPSPKEKGKPNRTTKARTV